MDARGILIADILRFLETYQPNSFIIENVPNLITQFSDVFDMILVECAKLCTSMYKVTWDVRDSRLHGGLTQQRKRIYIVGVKKSL